MTDRLRKQKREYYYRRRTTVEGKLKTLLAAARNRSKRYGRPFDLTYEYLAEVWLNQGGKCAITGEDFDLTPPEDTKHSHAAPSLDQIMPGEGYTQGNVRLVTYQCNMALNQWGENRLIKFAKLVLEERG